MWSPVSVFSRPLSKPCVRSVSKILTLETINPSVLKVDYAVRGPVLQLAEKISQEIEQGKSQYPFQSVIKANIGDAQAAEQPYLTFYRQLMACVAYPALMEDPGIPDDVKTRASAMLEASTGHSTGAYSPGLGLDVVRQHVSSYMERRDGHLSRPEDIIITTGASAAIRYCFQMLRDIDNIDKCEKPVGIMTPVPLYPIFSALLSEYSLTPVEYYLDEGHQWTVDFQELERAYEEAQDCNVRGIVLINPGNPTGQVFSKQIIEDIIKFAHKYNLFIIADEVYQDNVCQEGVTFHSVKKCMLELGPPYSGVGVASLLTISKGYSGEAGARTGWMEVLNLSPRHVAQLHRIAESYVGPSTLGQAMVDAAVLPPSPGEPSYSSFEKEKSGVLTSLKERAQFLAEELDKIQGYSCNPIQGALYAFPRVLLPPRAQTAARNLRRDPDTHYTYLLLQQQGICVVPGSGFGQRPGTYHYRMSVLPPMDTLREAVRRIKDFHTQFLRYYS